MSEQRVEYTKLDKHYNYFGNSILRIFIIKWIESGTDQILQIYNAEKFLVRRRKE